MPSTREPASEAPGAPPAGLEPVGLDDSVGDVALVVLALAAEVTRRSEAHLSARGMGDLRASHGYVFQHLVTGAKSVSQLATALGMTPQGASKAVIALEDLGYVRRQPDPADARARLVDLTE